MTEEQSKKKVVNIIDSPLENSNIVTNTQKFKAEP